MGGQAVKAKLWLEGLLAFRRHVRAWTPPAIAFFLVYAVIGFFAFVHLQPLWQTLPHDLPQDTQARARLFVPLFTQGVGWLFLFELVVFVQYYSCIVFFSRRELPAGQPVLGVGRFFYAFAKALQLMLIYIGIGLLFGILIFAIKHVIAADESVMKTALAVVRLIMQVIVVYLAIRYYFVYVLAVNTLRPVLKSSWKLTKNNWWRLFWNKVVLDFWLVLFIVALVLIAGIVVMLWRSILPLPDATQGNPLSVIMMASFATALSVGILSAFSCVACRILLEEKRQSDPSFVLATRA
jgi:hypothetical protein